MKKLAISAVATASLALVFWAAFQWTRKDNANGGMSVATAAVPESDATAAPPVGVDPLQSGDGTDVHRSALEQPAEQVAEPGPAVVESVPSRDSTDGTIEVLVVDAAGVPIEGATVSSTEVALSVRIMTRSGFRSRDVSPKTDEQGLARVTLGLEGVVRVIAKADGFATASSEVLELDAVAERDRIKVTLTEGGSVEGRLLDIAGAPAVDVPITLHLRNWPGSAGGGRASRQTRRTTTSADGTFLFENTTPGPHTLYTRAEGDDLNLVPSARIELEVKEGERTVVQFPEVSDSFVRVHGTVIRNSEPLANARINVSWAERSRGFLGKKARADGNGEFTIILDEAAEYRFQVSAGEGGGSVFRRIDVPPVEDHEVLISFDTGNLSGHIRGPDGEPVVGIKVTAFGRSPDERRNSNIQSATTQAGGTFEFLNLVAGSYKLEAKTIESVAQVVPLTAPPKYPHLGSAELKDVDLLAGETLSGVDLVLSAAAAMNGQVLNQDGRPVVGATVELKSVRSYVPGKIRIPHSSKWKTTVSGKFSAGGFDPGDYRVRATRHKKVSPWVTVKANPTETVTVPALILQPGTLMEIEAQWGGAPLSRAFIQLRNKNGVRSHSGILENGKGQLGPVLPGTYTLTVGGMDGAKPETEQDVTVHGEPSLKVAVELAK